jgi:hypothetical protein
MLILFIGHRLPKPVISAKLVLGLIPEQESKPPGSIVCDPTANFLTGIGIARQEGRYYQQVFLLSHIDLLGCIVQRAYEKRPGFEPGPFYQYGDCFAALESVLRTQGSPDIGVIATEAPFHSYLMIDCRSESEVVPKINVC